MSGSVDAQVGVIKEVTYGTALAVTRFFEFVKEGVSGKYERIESDAIRTGRRVLHKDRFQVNPKGAEGDLNIEVVTKQFAFWLEHMLGTVATTGPVETSVYTHTGTVGDLFGKSFTMQVGRVDSAGVVNPFTYSGGKVANWELSNDVDGILQFSAGLDFAVENVTAAGVYALATQTLPTNSHLMTFVGGEITVAATQVPVTKCSVKGDNGLKTDRYFVRKSTAKKEPKEEGQRKYDFSLTAEFDGFAQYNRVISATNAGALAALVLYWDGPVLAGSTLFPRLTVSIPLARFDEAPINVDGATVIEQTITGKAVDDAAASPITITYQSLDVTV